MLRLLIVLGLAAALIKPASAMEPFWKTGPRAIICSSITGAREIFQAYSREAMKALGCRQLPEDLEVEPLQRIGNVVIALLTLPDGSKHRVYFAMGIVDAQTGRSY